MSSKQGPREAEMRTSANAACRRKRQGWKIDLLCRRQQ